MKNLDYYMSLPYNFVITPINDESGFYYFIRVLELDGCMSDGETREEALVNIYKAMEGWIEASLDNGFEVPEPIGQSDFSGKFTLRLPKSLHRRLTIEADREGVSLNQYALYKLSV
ncbi:MAG: type II toxin-antitoxin system HicB family antitoxin [Clostridiales bacterium]|jgi:predicted RNase H-like HicB family nuclease|nr:type II toxin-antitoxin system HicB family antitoxin [Clostridiales bacterium]